MKAAESLVGLDLDSGWHVDELVKRPSGGTGGYSCISYLVSNKEGEKAFLKALDFSAALQEEDPARLVFVLTMTLPLLIGHCELEFSRFY